MMLLGGEIFSKGSGGSYSADGGKITAESCAVIVALVDREKWGQIRRTQEDYC
jgi:hypothetical protein